MYSYILKKYVNRDLDAEQVHSLVPIFITQEQADTIVATPRKEVTE